MMKFSLVLLFSTLFVTSTLAGQCEDYIKEANAASGVVPNIVDGKLKSLSIYATKSFMAPKGSLIDKARRQAEMSAKRDFSSWIKEKVSAKTLNEELMEAVEKTNSDGSSQGTAEEITRYSDQISNSTSSVLSGIIKLDECVDTAGKTVYVRIGWKAELSAMAADTRASMDNSIKRGKQGKSRDNKASISKTTNPSSSSQKKASNNGSGVKIISVTVIGYGINEPKALNAALKQAVSQVFGEQFQAETTTFDSLVSAESTDSSGATQGAALETSAMAESIRTKTKGIIHSYSIVSRDSKGEETVVTVNVNLAKYDNSMDSSKKSIVVLKPKYTSGNKSVDSQSFTTMLQDAIESKLSGSDTFNILDRENLSDMNKEMNFISQNSNISEISRIGNMAGADRIVITTVKQYSPSSTQRKVGDRTITSSRLNAIVSLKVVDPASTNVLLSRNVVIKDHMFPGSVGSGTYVALMADKIARYIDATSKNSKTSNKKHSSGSRGSSIKKTEKEVNKRIEKLKNESNDDW